MYNIKGICFVPGQEITSDPTLMKGHGTFSPDSDSNIIISSVAGCLDRVDKLIRVEPFKTRYIGHVGDVVIGRIRYVEQKEWKVDIHAQHLATLQLSAIHLPGGIQRRKLESDELQIRSYFEESDLISAEVQSIHQDGSMSIHTRSQRYGKLHNGICINVSPNQIQRSKSHFCHLNFGIDMILGRNGYIWIGKLTFEVSTSSNIPNYLTSNFLTNEKNDHDQKSEISFSKQDFENISRLRNIIIGLDRLGYMISEFIILSIFDATLKHSCSSIDLLQHELVKHYADSAIAQFHRKK